MDLLSRDNPIRDICALMGVSRAGYYKWKNRGPSPRDTKREEIVALVKQVHAAHPTHGYRWTAARALSRAWRRVSPEATTIRTRPPEVTRDLAPDSGSVTSLVPI